MRMISCFIFGTELLDPLVIDISLITLRALSDLACANILCAGLVYVIPQDDKC